MGVDVVDGSTSKKCLYNDHTLFYRPTGNTDQGPTVGVLETLKD